MQWQRVRDLSPTLPAMYPFAGRILDVGGFRLHYLDEGDGEPVVMLHGNPTWSFYYRDLVQRAARLATAIIVPDHIGCGLSDKPDDGRYPYTLARRVDDLDALLEHLGVARERHPGPARLGRHDRHGLGAPASGTDRPAGAC